MADRYERLAEKYGAQIRREGLGRRRVMQLAGLSEKRARNLLRYLKETEHDESVGSPEPYQPIDEHSPRPRTHLVVGDSHVEPGQDLRRFKALGNYVRRNKIEVVVFIGDHWTLNSMCSYTTLAERARESLMADLESGQRALDVFLEALGDWREHTKLVYTVGNHDERIMRIAAEYPWMEGSFGYHSFGLEERGFTVVPFLEPIRIDGVRYQHFLPNRGTRRAVSGKYHADRLLDRLRYAESITVGHSHRLQHRWVRNLKGDEVNSLVAGCFFEHEEEYAGDDNHEWWRGLCICHDVKDGSYDLELLSMDRLLREYL